MSSWVYKITRRFFECLSGRTNTHVNREHLLFVNEELIGEDDNTPTVNAVLI